MLHVQHFHSRRGALAPQDSTTEQTAEKGGLTRHSEQSEVRFSIARFSCDESPFGGNPRKEGFLTPQTPFGMTEWCFFHKQGKKPCPDEKGGYLSFAMLMRLGKVMPALRGVSTEESPTLMV